MTSASGKWNIASAVSSKVSYSSNGITIDNPSSYGASYFENMGSIPLSVELTCVNASGGDCPIFGVRNNDGTNTVYIDGVGNESPKKIRCYKGESHSDYTVTDLLGHYMFKVYSDRVEFYFKDNLLHTWSSTSLTNPKFNFSIGSNRSLTFKDFKIKPL